MTSASKEFLPSSEVVAAADAIRIVIAAHYCCPIVTDEGVRCRQAIAAHTWDGQHYLVSEHELRGALLAHLIQKHGWTREHVGER